MRLLSAIALAVTMASVVPAQSLGDLAKQEAARRKEVKSSGKVITNDSLRSGPVSSPPPVARGQSPAPAPGQADAAAGTKGSMVGAVAVPVAVDVVQIVEECRAHPEDLARDHTKGRF